MISKDLGNWVPLVLNLIGTTHSLREATETMLQKINALDISKRQENI